MQQYERRFQVFVEAIETSGRLVSDLIAKEAKPTPNLFPCLFKGVHLGLKDTGYVL